MGRQGSARGSVKAEALLSPRHLSLPPPPSFRKEHLFFVVVIVYDFIHWRQRGHEQAAAGEVRRPPSKEPDVGLDPGPEIVT